MSYEFKPEYYQAEVAKQDAIQAELFKGGIQNEALFMMEMRLKWKKVCLVHQTILPEVKKQLPKKWELRLAQEDEQALDLNFLDCSREVSFKPVVKENPMTKNFSLDCSRVILSEAA